MQNIIERIGLCAYNEVNTYRRKKNDEDIQKYLREMIESIGRAVIESLRGLPYKDRPCLPPEEVIPGADELHESDAVTAAMMAAGGLVLTKYVQEIPTSQAAFVARRVFCAMHALEARLSSSGPKPDE